DGADSNGQSDTAGEPAGNMDPKFAGMPPSMIEAMANADPRHGEMLTLSSGCTGCHSTDPNMLMAGPTWYNISANAPTRVAGESAGLYLYTSITDPNAYIVDGYQPNIMLQTYKDTLPEQDLADIIAYLLTIRGR
ncbi:MAG: c-type cytochrome, partial [Caldilineaceae bacterium]